MKLEDITAVLRPRSAWESVDLGVVLLRAFYKPVIAAWLFAVLPACALIFVVTASEPLLGFVVIWLLRPMFDRVPLYVLSRSLFGATPTLGETLSALPRLWTHDLWGGLILHRLHLARPLLMPISELEGLRGSQRGDRHRLIAKSAGGTAFTISITCVLFELVFLFSGLALAYMMIPSHILMSFDWSAIFEQAWVLWLIRVLFLIGLTAVAPLCVACGFTLYINRRTHLEGWDLELAVRRIGRRLAVEAKGAVQKAGVLVALCTLTGGLLAGQQVEMQGESARDPAVVIGEVLEHEDFDRTSTYTKWELPDFLDFSSGRAIGGIPGLGLLFEVLLWGALFVLLVFLIYQACKYFGVVSIRTKEAVAKPEPPRELFGLDFRPETLPDDIPGTAWQLWQANDPVGALGLLYRGAISRLIEGDSLELSSSDT